MTAIRQVPPTTKRPQFATLLVMALDPREVGARIAQRRRELGWTHQRLADEMGVELRTAQRWQDGINQTTGKSSLPRLATLMELAEKMGVEQSYFVDEEAPPSETALLKDVADGVEQLERSQESVLQKLDEVLARLATLEDGMSPPGERRPGRQ